jgi:hypothetical protein
MEIQTTKVLALKEADFGFSSYIVRVNNWHIDSKKSNNEKFFGRDAVMITNTENGASILRYIVGNPGTMSLTKSDIGLDYDGVDSLNVDFNEPANLNVASATKWQVYLWYMNHQDLNIRISTRLGVLGAVLGIIGFITGFLPLFI